MLKQNAKAPDFSLPDQNGKMHSLAGQKGKWVLIYFYPKDDTPGCTKEACTIRDNLPDFKRMDCVVFGISGDSVKSHDKFAKKYKLPFIILADETKGALKKYGAWQKKSFLGKSYMGIKRISYLIDPDGRVAKVYPNVKPLEHAQEVLEDLAALQ